MRTTLLIALAMLGSARIGAASVPTQLNIQGRLSGNGSDGVHALQFQIYDAETAGNLIWTETQNVTVESSLFSSILGQTSPLPASLFLGQALWLEVAVDGSALDPRRPLLSTPYSFRAQRADTATVALNGMPGGQWETDGTSVWRPSGQVGIGNPSPLFALDVANGDVRIQRTLGGPDFVLSTPPTDIRLFSQFNVPVNIGTNGDAFKLTILPSGNVGIGSGSPSERLQVAGVIHSSSGGVRFPDGTLQTTAATGSVSQWSNNGSSIYYSGGNVGIANSGPQTLLQIGGAYGGSGPYNMPSGNTLYVNSSSTADEKAAVFAGNDATTGNTKAILGVIRSPGKSGGSSVAVMGVGDNSGQAVGGAALGVLGRVFSFKNPATTASVPTGVFGEGLSTAGVCWGVAGETASGVAGSAGVKATGRSTTGSARALWAETKSHSGYAIYAASPDAINDVAIHAEGKIEATGTISAPQLISYAITPSAGPVMTYGLQAAEPMVQDMGRTQLSAGMARVLLDRVFLETVASEGAQQLLVHVTPNGPTGQLWVEVLKDGFVIHDPAGSSSAVSYLVFGKRRGMEGVRLQPLAEPSKSLLGDRSSNE